MRSYARRAPTWPKVARSRSGRFRASAKALVSPAARQTLESVGWVRRELWDEISEIEHDPTGRGKLYDENEDPELAGLRIDLAIAGWAVFCLVIPDGQPYVVSIKPWDYPEG